MTIAKELARFGIPSEDERYGYAQAVKVGTTIYVSGQTASGDTSGAGPGDMEAQMRTAYAKVARALEQYGATLDNVVEEILFVSDLSAAAAVARDVRRDVYGGTPQVASTLIHVAPFGLPDLLIEIKCVACV
jgi:enamine deaminase RidA (YjgF/YER057c/UK114 family)